MTVQFIEVQGMQLTGATALPGAKVVIATSQIVMIKPAKNNTCELVLKTGNSIHAGISYDDLKIKLGVVS